MDTFLGVLHIIIAALLVGLVLLQDPKSTMGAFASAASSQSLFGATGATSFLNKLTRVIAILFAVSCLGLTYISSRKESSVLDKADPAAVAPVNPAAKPGASATPAPGGAATDAKPAVEKPAETKAAPPPAETKK